jgi:hypothetical protein
MARLFPRSMYLAAIMLLAVQSQAANARRVWPVVGAHGDVGVMQECPSGQVLVGFDGQAGDWIDQIRILCAPLLADGTHGNAAPFGDRFGGFGGAPAKASCESSQRVHSANIVLTEDGKKVEAIDLTCTNQDGLLVKYAEFLTKDHMFTADQVQVTQMCPQEEFTGFTVRYGKDVNGVGFICDQRIALAAPAPAPSPTDTRAPVAVAQNVSIESTNFPGMFWRHQNWQGVLSKLSSDVDYKDAAFVEGPALTRQGKTAVSFESVEYPGYYLRHKNFVIVLEKEDGSQQFAQDASFNQIHRTGRGTAFESVNFPGMFIRHKDFKLRVDKDDGTEQFAKDSAFKVDPPAGPPNTGPSSN